MVPGPPSGWKQRFSADVVVYEAPDGESRIRCFQGVPLEPLSQIVRRVTGPTEMPIDSTRSLVSAEGEYGAVCCVGGRIVGVLFGDATAIALEAPRRHEPLVCELLLTWRLQLGVRSRRFLYRPPAGWSPMPNGLVTTWFPPEFPDDHAQLVVFPATPITIDARDELAQLLAIERASGAIIGEIREHALVTAHGLTGQHWSIAIQRDARSSVVIRELVSVRRAPYRYAMKLEATSPQHREVVLDVARSIRAIPPTGQEWIAAGHASLDASAHWTD
ncbi:MAG: hypothetical protein ACKV2T_16395 [Kofleriaceae bacterium]